MSKKKWNFSALKLHTIAFLLFFLAVSYVTYPLIFHFGDRATGLGDELLISYIQNWVIHSLTHPLSLFQASIYYPYHNTLAYSDLFLTSSIFSVIPLLISGQPITADTWTLFSSLVLLGFCSYVFAYYFTRNFFASLLSGFLIIFSPAVLDKSVHVQILAIFWVYLAVLFCILFLKTKKYRYLIFSSISFLFQTWNSFMPGYFIIIAFAVLLSFFFIYQRKTLKVFIHKKVFYIVILTGILLVPFVLPYLQVSKEFSYVRDIRDTIHFALQPEDFFFAFNYTILTPFFHLLQHPQTYPNNVSFKTGYLGGLFTLLSFSVIVFFIKTLKKKNLYFQAFLCIGLAGFLLSLGPFLHIGRQTIHHPFPIPLPYALFYYLAPGFQGFRNSARFEMLGILFFAVAIAMMLTTLLREKSILIKVVIYIILFLGIIAEYSFPMTLVAVSQKAQFPPVYAWLAKTDPTASIIEMPIYNWNMFPYGNRELMREYFATMHFRNMVNGYSGFSPPEWQTFVYDLDATFPQEQAIKRLKDLPITYIIVHTDEYDQLHASKFVVKKTLIPSGRTVLATIEKNKELKLEKHFSATYVFSIK